MAKSCALSGLGEAHEPKPGNTPPYSGHAESVLQKMEYILDDNKRDYALKGERFVP